MSSNFVYAILSSITQELQNAVNSPKLKHHERLALTINYDIKNLSENSKNNSKGNKNSFNTAITSCKPTCYNLFDKIKFL